MVGPRPDQATRPRSASRCGGTDNEAAAVVVDVQGKLGGHIFYTTSLGHLGSIDRYKEGTRPLLPSLPFLPSFLIWEWDAAADTVDPRFFTRGDLADVQSSGIFERERDEWLIREWMDQGRGLLSLPVPTSQRKEGKSKSNSNIGRSSTSLCRGPFRPPSFLRHSPGEKSYT